MTKCIKELWTEFYNNSEMYIWMLCVCIALQVVAAQMHYLMCGCE